MADPWAVVATKPAPTSPYETEAQFRSRMDSVYGPGKWRETSGYRDPAHNRAVGGVQGSAHTRGTPDAPGAHDIVVPGMPEALAAGRLPKDYKALPEGRVGGEGPHIHITDADPWAVVKDNPWGVVSEKPVAPAPKPAAPKPAPQPGLVDQALKAGGDLVQRGEKAVSDWWNAPSAAQGGGVEDAARAIGHRFMEGARGYVGHELAVPKTPQEVAQRVLESVNPAMNPAVGGLFQMGTSPVGGAVEAVARGAGSKHAKAIGDVAEFATPIPAAKGAEAARLAERGAVLGTEEAERIVGARPTGYDPALPRGAAATRAQLGAEGAAAGDAARLSTSTVPKPGEWVVRSERAAPKRRTLPAAVELPPRTNIVGDEANPATRTANALYRLQGSNIADKIELGRARAELKKAHGDKSEALYHALEEPLVKPGAEVPEELAGAKAALDPYLKEQTTRINRLRQRADPTLDAYLEDQGYVHRIRSDQPDVMGSADEGGPRSPFQSRKSLVKTASSQKQRKFVALEDTETGKRTVVDTSKDPAMKELRPGMEYRPPGEGPQGAAPRVFKVSQPTTREIEASSDVRYKKDAIDNTIANVFQLRRVERNLDVLEQTLQDMKERGVAHKEEVRFKGPDGENRIEHTKGEVPKGFRTLPDVPQLKGWVFDHGDAQVQELKDWLPKHDEDWVTKLDRLNNFMLRSNFLSPFVHPKNIAEFWGVSRGWDWLHPEGYGRLARTLPEAWREVMTMGPKYRQYLREGSALLSADARTQDFNAFLTNTAGKQLIEDPKSFAALKQSFGDAISTPAKLYQQFQEASHKMMWSLGDTMMMQRVLELQEKGTPIRDAIRKAEEVIPNYRVPAQIMDSKTGGRFLHQLFANNRFFSVGRYHYNRLAAWGRMFKKIAVGTPAEKTEAVGQFLAMAVMGAFVLPALDKGLQMLTGNQNARVKRGGITALVDAPTRAMKGEISPSTAIAQVVDLSPEAQLATQAIGNKDYFGDEVLSRFKDPASNIASAANLPLSQFGPLQGGLEALSPTYGPQRVAGNMFGVDLPQRPPGAVKGSTAKMLRRKYQKQGQKDPLTRGLQSLGVP